MANSLLSNLLYNSSNDNDTDAATDRRDGPTTISDAERQHMVALLQATTKCVQDGTCDAVIYQTMGALHRYTATYAGVLSSTAIAMANGNANATTPLSIETNQKPSFVRNPQTTEPDNNSDYEGALAYGWVEELSSSEDEEGDPSIAWNSVLALLTQKEHDDEPCLWITQEVLERKDCESSKQQHHHIATPTTALETLHSIPLRRRLRSCRYQNFYGDHRVVLELKRGNGRIQRKTKTDPSKFFEEAIVLRCPSARSAKAWVDCLTQARKKTLDATTANIELEIVDPTPSLYSDDEDGGSTSSRPKRHATIGIVNVIDSEDDEDDYGIVETPLEEGEEDSPYRTAVSPTTNRLAVQLQDAEDRKRALKLAVKQAAAAERARQQKEEEDRLAKKRLELQEKQRLEQELQQAREKEQKAAMERKKEEETQRKRLAAIEKNVESIAKATTTTNTTTTPKPAKPKPMTAAEKQQQRMEREIAARKRAEEDRRRIELEYEQKKKERVEQRRRDLEAQRKAAREEQKRKEQLQKQRFLESEQRKEAMKAAAKKAIPKKAVKGVFSTMANEDSKSNNTKGDLWFSLNKHMSAFETADAERKRREAEKREEEKAKAEAEQEEEDPEQVRKRIAEEARQRLVQEEVGKRSKEAEAMKKKQAEAANLNGGGTFRQPQNGWAGKQPQGSTSPLGASISPEPGHHKSVPHSSVTPPTSANPPHLNMSPNSVPSVPPLHHPQMHTQSWNRMKQQQPPPPPPYPPTQQPNPFQRPQEPAGAKYQSAQGYRQQQQQHPSTQTPPGSFGNPQYQPHPMQHQQQPQAQPPMPGAQRQAQPAPHLAPAQPPQQANGGAEFSESVVRRNVLIQWGLLPPNMQVLKPVDELLCSIHTVFPPAFGVASHEYFTSWKPISRSELVSSSGILEESKLKKSVRKVRFFLHPDKLPHDLAEDQNFLCKLLWDVINDAFEEYKRSKEDLDWM